MAAPTHRPWEVLPTREDQLTEKWFLIGWSSGIISSVIVLLVYFAVR